MVRREIVGILLISVVASTLLTYYLRREAATPVEILDLNIPEAIPPGQKSVHEILAGLVLRKRVESLLLDFDCLLNVTGEEDPTGGVEESVQVIRRLLDSAGASYTVEEIQVEDGSATLYDFSQAFSVLAPRLATLSSTTVYCIVEIGGEKFAFRGVSDFFVNRNCSIASLTLSKNEVPETYLTMQAGEAKAQGKPSIMEAPILGRKGYNATSVDDRLSVRMIINSIGVPGHSGILEVLRVYAEGEPVIARGFVIPASVQPG